MIILIDSHALVWWLSGNARLSRRANEVISSTPAFVSVASAYEIGLKVFGGRWAEARFIVDDFAEICAVNNITIVPISLSHALKAAAFEVEHRDPFDRLLAAQSIVEDLAIVTVDPAFKLFGCKTIW